MANDQRPIVPAADATPVAPPVTPSSSSSQPPRADHRSPQAARVRATVRKQLAHSQRRRQELSHALGALRRDLREMRNQVRTRLRDMTYHAASRRPAMVKAAAAAAAEPEPLVIAPDPPMVVQPAMVVQPPVAVQPPVIVEPPVVVQPTVVVQPAVVVRPPIATQPITPRPIDPQPVAVRSVVGQPVAQISPPVTPPAGVLSVKHEQR